MTRIMCIDGGGTAIKYNIMDEGGHLLYASDDVPSPKSTEDLVAVITKFIADTPEKIDGLAFSMPGFINSKTGYIANGGALTYLSGTYFFELLEHLNLPITIENDARSVALAEYYAGAAKGCDNFACITIGTGIGAGLMVNGQLLVGHTYRAGEFGWNLVSTKNGPLPYHYLASTSALINNYKMAKGLPANAQVTGHDVFGDLDDPKVVAVLDDWYYYLALIVLNLASTFNFEKVLFGGGVSARPDLIEQIKAKLEDINDIHIGGIPKVWGGMFELEVDTCQFRNDAGFIGAYYHFKSVYPELF